MSRALGNAEMNHVVCHRRWLPVSAAPQQVRGPGGGRQLGPHQPDRGQRRRDHELHHARQEL